MHRTSNAEKSNLEEEPEDDRRRVGSRHGMAAFAWMLRWFPRFLVYWIALLPVVYYYFRRPEVRASSPDFQRKLGRDAGPLGRMLFGMRQAAAFSRVILDNMYLGVAGPKRFKLNFTATEIYRKALERGKGLVLLSAHVGNWHLAVNFLGRTGRRAHMVTEDVRAPEVRRHMDAAKKRAIHLEVHDANEGPSLVFKLRDALEAGDVVVLSGDRAYGGRELEAQLLGETARFPALGFSLASTTGAPVCIGMAFSTGMQSYDFIGVGPLNDELPEGMRGRAAMAFMAQRYADYLTEQVRRFPTQWFNFNDFWGDGEKV